MIGITKKKFKRKAVPISREEIKKCSVINSNFISNIKNKTNKID